MPINCGDADEDHTFEDCVFIGQQEKRMKMVEKRMAFTGIAFDETTLWIVGDSCEDNNVLCSTEFLKLGHPSVIGPDLPFKINIHSDQI